MNIIKLKPRFEYKSISIANNEVDLKRTEKLVSKLIDKGWIINQNATTFLTIHLYRENK
jgi:hypothetical protein